MKKNKSHIEAEALIKDAIEKANKFGWTMVAYIVPNPDMETELNRVIGSCGGESKSLQGLMFHATNKVLTRVKQAEEDVVKEEPHEHRDRPN